MSKVSKEEIARLSGAEWAYEKIRKLIEEKGLKGLDEFGEELEMRGAQGMPLKVSVSDAEKYAEMVKKRADNHAILLSAYVLHDRFGFSPDDLTAFMDCFADRTEALKEKFLTEDDISQVLYDETGLEIKTPGK